MSYESLTDILILSFRCFSKLESFRSENTTFFKASFKVKLREKMDPTDLRFFLRSKRMYRVTAARRNEPSLRFPSSGER